MGVLNSNHAYASPPSTRIVIANPLSSCLHQQMILLRGLPLVLEAIDLLALPSCRCKPPNVQAAVLCRHSVCTSRGTVRPPSRFASPSLDTDMIEKPHCLHPLIDQSSIVPSKSSVEPVCSRIVFAGETAPYCIVKLLSNSSPANECICYWLDL